MQTKRKLAASVVAGLVGAIALTVPAQAAGNNYATSWETLLGAKWNGYVQIQAS